jgi:hypothetical protein
LLSALAQTSDVRAGPPLDVLLPESRDLTVAESGLYRDQQQGPISPSDPGAESGSGHQGRALGLSEELDGPAFIAFDGYRQDSLAMKTEARFTDGDVSEERVQRREAVVARPRGVVSRGFEMVEKFAQKRHGEVVNAKGRRRSFECGLREAKQETKGARRVDQ